MSNILWCNMGIFSKLFNRSERTQVTVIKNWRPGMWVVASGNRIGILFELGETCGVHLVERSTGATIDEISVPLTSLRQAKFGEIPECRRIGLTKEKAEVLGYGT